MKKRKVILKILFLRNFFLLYLLLFSFDSYGCPDAFESDPGPKLETLPLFDTLPAPAETKTTNTI